MARVAVAMSGGVDSSVAAALLVEQGHDVIGLMLRLWSEPGTEDSNRCCTPDAMAMARRVAARLDIPFYAIDAQQVFFNTVVTPFIDGYAQGITPNPCMSCNRHIRWGHLYQHAVALNADFLATGHYARINRPESGSIRLLRAVHKEKDQSYILHVLTPEKLAHTLFPVGEYPKEEVRLIASRHGLATAHRRESQDLCFLAGGDYRDFLKRQGSIDQNLGPILDSSGNPLGEHLGLANYTIGQRKGIGISAASPLYVIAKDFHHNALIVGPFERLGQTELIAGSMNWLSIAPPSEPFAADVKIRYRAREVPGKVTPISAHQIHIAFNSPIRDITPGQAAVLYDGDVCLGGGIIQP